MVTLMVNGIAQTVDAPDDMPLLWALRENLKLTGTKYGCGVAACGACTVLIDGTPVRSCAMPIGVASGRKIVTIEAVGRDPLGRRVQDAWVRHDVPQCGYCQSGQVMTAVGLLKANPKPNPQQIMEGMSGNLCRCGAYQRIRAAVLDAARRAA